MILTLRTDSPIAEIGLFAIDGTKHSYVSWQADRRLAKELLQKIRAELDRNDVKITALSGALVFRGPGSFTGLRIGITVANTLAYGLGIPIVGSEGEHWIEDGVRSLAQGKSERLVLPHYSADAHITQPKK